MSDSYKGLNKKKRDCQLHICIVSTWIPSKKCPYFAPFVYDLAENLARSNFKVSIIGPKGEGDESLTKTDLMTIYRVNSRLPMFSMLYLVDKIKPDVLHVHAPISLAAMLFR